METNYLKKEIVNIVKEILTENKKARDSKELLIYLFLEKYFKEKGIDIKTISTLFLFEYIFHEKIRFESITRVSRKLQEEYPSLRGELYQKRIEKKDKVKQEILNFKIYEKPK